MRVLITGAAGLYGLHLMRRLSQNKNCEAVYALDTGFDRPGVSFLPEGGRIVKIKKDFRQLTVREINRMEVDRVVHLAGYSSPAEAVQDPEEYFRNNVEGFFKFLHVLLRTRKRPLLIYLSCCHVYGFSRYLPVDESHPACPRDFFAAGKVAAEAYCRAAFAWYNYPVIIVRSSHTYGPGMACHGYAGVVANFIRKALRGENLVLYNDGEEARDFLYGEDAARALELLLEKGEKLAGQTFNLGTGKPVTVKTLAEKVLHHTGGKGELIYIPTGRPGLEIYAADTAAIKKATGWEATTSLDEGIKQTVAWMQEAIKSPLL
ncbi:MAG: UDP-glucose 4-epimerase [Eubacteriales bacterium]|nr:UDP-glucose 4-epimerase [Eubacteriales bacterium]MDN5363136.1 UDP-glucose 4-epimerase [Eubacteriales bacterium]